MAESSTPSTFSGGKVTGTLKTEHIIPRWLKRCQKGWLFLNSRIVGFSKGRTYFPNEIFLRGASILVDDRRGKYVCVSTLKKSKILWRPGFTPVWNEDQATGEMGGQVVWRGENDPVSFSLARLGSFPWAMKLPTRSGSSPSRPRITTLSTELFAYARLYFLIQNRRRAGHVIKFTIARKKAINNIKNEVITAKPAPGPM